MLHRSPPGLRLLHRGTTSSPQNVYRSVDVSVRVGATFGTHPLPIRKRKIIVVMSTVRTRFRSRCPLPDLNKLTIMFDTLELQNLNELVKSEVRDLSSPQTLHGIKVQRLRDDGIKTSTQVGRQFIVPIPTLVGNIAIKPCQVSDDTPPIVRAFNLSTDGFVKFAELVQGLFQGLWMLDFLTRVHR